MKVVLLFLSVVSSVYASDYKVIGYVCPSGYEYNYSNGLCYLGSTEGVQDVATEEVSKTRSAIPETTKRRKYLDKEGLAKILEGDFFKEEP